MYTATDAIVANDPRAAKIARELEATELARNLTPAVRWTAYCLLVLPLLAIAALIVAGA
jgi:hypothetical protein